MKFVFVSAPRRCALRTALLGLLLAASSLPAQFTTDREPPGPSSRRTGLALTEIFYHPRLQPPDPVQSLEFIELYNSLPWAEDISRFSITGDVSYTFPEGTVLAPFGYLVVARQPNLVGVEYGITNVVGPWDGWQTNRLSVEQGVVQLRNRQGAVLLEVEYNDSPPWPEGADGTGHSMVLARPSYGENHPMAWAQSDTAGGSPGGPDPLTPDPLASVVINEWQNHSDPVDWVELYNHSNQPVDLSGAILSDDPAATNRFRVPDGTTLPGRGFVSYDADQMGFDLFAGGETIFFWSSNMTRLIDVIDFRGQSNNVTTGRWPDGASQFYTLTQRTRGGPNAAPLHYPVLINEIMYNPISGNPDEEYIEIHNRGPLPVEVAGWEFVVGIRYVFPTNNLTLAMPPGAHWVVARNPEHLRSIYPNLTTNNTFGPYDGSLANGGERVILASDDQVRFPDQPDEKLQIPVSEVTYSDGGRWTSWSDGDGSSIELISPFADPRHPSSWTDSVERGDSRWTAIEMTVPLGPSLGSPVNDSLILFLQGEGECLVDEVEVRADDGPNLVVNGGFESGLEGWSLQGSHDFSSLDDEAFSGGASLHVRAGSRGENQSNRILSAPFAQPIPPGTQRVSIRAKAKWIRGFPELMLRLHGSATEAYGRMALPRNLGTPGMTNSVYRENLGPSVYDVRHHPPLPEEDQPVAVTARAIDPQGNVLLTLHYRIDPDPEFTSVPMVDNGTGQDAVAGDGLYTATLPAQPAGTMAAFYVEGRDPLNAVGTFPHQLFPEPGLDRTWPIDAIARECVVRWGEVQMPGDFATYHLWVTAANSNRWHHRDAMNNTEVDGTFVYNNSRVIYNALPLYSGSPWHRTNSTTGPAGPNRVDYEMNFRDDDPLLGATDFVLNNSGNPDILTISDHSAVAEQTVYELFEAMDMPHNNRRYIHFFVNGSQRSTAHERPGNFIFEDSQQPNGDMIEQWFPGDDGGPLFKVEDWFEFERNGFDFTAFDDADLVRVTRQVDGQEEFFPGPYRYKFRKRSINTGNSANDFAPLYELVDAVSPADNPDGEQVDPARIAPVVDAEAWMRHFALQRAVGNFDSYGWERGKNDYLYLTTNGFVHMPWDIDYGLGLGSPADAPLFESNDPRVRAMFNTPAIARAYWRAFRELVDGPFQNSFLDPLIDQRVAALLANDVNIDLDAVAGIKQYIADRRAYLIGQLATVEAPFSLDIEGDIVTSNNLVVLTGTAPVQVREITVNGEVYPVTWTSVTAFELRLVIPGGLQLLSIAGVDRFGEPVPGALADVFTEYTGPVIHPADALRFNEIMYRPEMPGGQFVELINISPIAFDLGSWWIDGLEFTFPVGTILTNGQTAVLVEDRAVFEALYGASPVVAEFPGTLNFMGEVLALLGPDDSVINALRYEADLPWPPPLPGHSLQLIDPARDNRRASNWAVDESVPATPGSPNSVLADLPDYDPLWLNELQAENFAGPTDNFGEHDSWIELHNAGPEPVSLEGYYLATQYASNLTQWAFPAGAVLAPGEYRLVWGDGQPGQGDATDLHTDFRLDFEGRLALVRLLPDGPEIVDHLQWPSHGANASFGSHPDAQPAWREILYLATPGAPNERLSLNVFVNEWMARNSGAVPDLSDGDYDDWFELFNGEPFTVDLGGLHLTDDLEFPNKFLIPDNGQYQIPPGGFLLVWADDEVNQNDDDEEELHVNFKLSGDGGVIALVAPDGMTPLSMVSYGVQTNNVSQGLFTDGADAIYDMPEFTPGTRNLVPGINIPPKFPPLPEASLFPGERVTLITRAEDPDVPEQFLTYTYEPVLEGTGMNISGLFRWIVPSNQPPGDYVFTLHATDNGVPPRSDSAELNFHILDPEGGVVVGARSPLIQRFYEAEGEVTLTFGTELGRVYRVLYKENLEDSEWQQLGREFVAANPTASISDASGLPRRFYVIEVVD